MKAPEIEMLEPALESHRDTGAATASRPIRALEIAQQSGSASLNGPANKAKTHSRKLKFVHRIRPYKFLLGRKKWGQVDNTLKTKNDHETIKR